MAYLELQSNKNDFKILSSLADYSSILTRVCCFSQYEVKQLNMQYPDILKKYLTGIDIDLDKICRPIVKLSDGKLYIENSDSDILSYLNIRSSIKPEIKIINLPRVFELINAGIIDINDEFINKFTNIDENTKLNELFTSTGKMKFRGKLWSLEDIGVDKCVKDMNFDTAQKVKSRYIVLKNLEVQSYNSSSHTVILNDKNKKQYTAKFFGISPILSQILHKGRIINIASKKVYGSDEEESGYTIVSPMIIPKDFNLKFITIVKCSTKIPIAIYNAAYSEVNYRKLLNSNIKEV